eukprot:gene11129-23264_t
MEMSMPEPYDERVAMLNNILQRGFEHLLVTAKKNDVLEAPYGRPPTPTPFVDDDEEDLDSGSGDDDDDDFVEFKYEYGFNPLKFLGDFIMKSHPATLATLQRKISEAHLRLKSRVTHANKQIDTYIQLSQMSDRFRCGILHGPLTTPLSPTSVLCMCRSLALGEVVVQIALNSSFTDILLTTKEKVTNMELPVKITINSLLPGTKYFIRCCLQDEGYLSLEERALQAKALAVAQQSSGFGSSTSKMPNRKMGKMASSRIASSPASVTTTTTTPLPPKATTPLTMPAPIPQEDIPFDGRFRGVDEDSFRTASFWTLSNATGVDFMGGSDGEAVGVVSEVTLLALSRTTHTTVSVLDLQSETFSVPDGILSIPSASTKSNRNSDRVGLEGGCGGGGGGATVNCLLGDVFFAENNNRIHGNGTGGNGDSDVVVAGRPAFRENPDFRNNLWRLFHHSPAFNHDEGILRKSALLLAWDDKSRGADTALKAEEVVFKQYQSSVRKHERRQQRASRKASSKSAPVPSSKPPPVLQRPPLSVSVETLTKEIPLVLREDVTRQFYRMIPVSPTLQVAVLDTRNGYMGRQQVRWLRDQIFASPVVWTVVLSGVPLGMDIRLADNDGEGGGGEGGGDDNTQTEGGGVDKDGTGVVGGTGGVGVGVVDAEEEDDDREGSVDDDKDRGTGIDGMGVGISKGSLLYAMTNLRAMFEKPVVATGDTTAAGASATATAASGGGGGGGGGGDSIVQQLSSDSFNPNGMGGVWGGGGGGGGGRDTIGRGGRSGGTGLRDNDNINNVNVIENCDLSDDDGDSETKGGDVDETVGMEQITVDSGVVVLSGGLQQPFVTTYDLDDWGSPFLLEVGVGSTLRQKTSPPRHRPLPGLGRRVLYEPPVPTTTSTSSPPVVDGRDSSSQSVCTQPSGCVIKVRSDGLLVNSDRSTGSGYKQER